jgi:hypothetical protein
MKDFPHQAAMGRKELWIVQGAAQAPAVGQGPADYEGREASFFEKHPEQR